MRKWVVIEKEVGQTPLDAVEQFKAWSPAYQDQKMAYAGRLDPMASGKLLVLVGDECKNQKDYHALDKEYVVEVLLGVKSDSGDVLGLVSSCPNSHPPRHDVVAAVKSFIGPFTPPYPIFSSKTVQGKPLHTWTMEGRLDEIEIPRQTGEILKLSIVRRHSISDVELHELALKKVNSIPEVTDPRKALGKNFRRVPIRASWDKLLEDGANSYTIVTIRCTCRSGTYMRSLAEEIGKKLNTCGLALSIHRTQIGIYKKIFGIGFWHKKF